MNSLLNLHNNSFQQFSSSNPQPLWRPDSGGIIDKLRSLEKEGDASSMREETSKANEAWDRFNRIPPVANSSTMPSPFSQNHPHVNIGIDSTCNNDSFPQRGGYNLPSAVAETTTGRQSLFVLKEEKIKNLFTEFKIWQYVISTEFYELYNQLPEDAQLSFLGMPRQVIYGLLTGKAELERKLSFISCNHNFHSDTFLEIMQGWFPHKSDRPSKNRRHPSHNVFYRMQYMQFREAVLSYGWHANPAAFKRLEKMDRGNIYRLVRISGEMQDKIEFLEALDELVCGQALSTCIQAKFGRPKKGRTKPERLILDPVVTNRRESNGFNTTLDSLPPEYRKRDSRDDYQSPSLSLSTHVREPIPKRPRLGSSNDQDAPQQQELCYILPPINPTRDTPFSPFINSPYPPDSAHGLPCIQPMPAPLWPSDSSWSPPNIALRQPLNEKELIEQVRNLRSSFDAGSFTLTDNGRRVLLVAIDALRSAISCPPSPLTPGSLGDRVQPLAQSEGEKGM